MGSWGKSGPALEIPVDKAKIQNNVSSPEQSLLGAPQGIPNPAWDPAAPAQYPPAGAALSSGRCWMGWDSLLNRTPCWASRPNLLYTYCCFSFFFFSLLIFCSPLLQHRAPAPNHPIVGVNQTIHNNLNRNRCFSVFLPAFFPSPYKAVHCSPVLLRHHSGWQMNTQCLEGTSVLFALARKLQYCCQAHALLSLASSWLK